MSSYIALLRAVNVGGTKPIAMEKLRDFFTEIGFSEVQTLLNTGNVVFHADVGPASRLERMLEVEAEKRLRLKTEILVRTPRELNEVIAKNPFPREAQNDPGHLVVMFLREKPEQKRVEELRSAIARREVLKVKGREGYIVYPDGQGRSKLSVKLIETKLVTRGTGRNWNTVMKLAAFLK